MPRLRIHMVVLHLQFYEQQQISSGNLLHGYFLLHFISLFQIDHIYSPGYNILVGFFFFFQRHVYDKVTQY